MWPFSKKRDLELVVKTLLSQLSVTQIGGVPVSSAGGNPVDKYVTIDDVYSIVRKIVKGCKKVPIYAYAIKDKKSFQRYKSLEKTRRNKDAIFELKELSLELLGPEDALNKMLENPNQNQTKDEFLEACYTMMLLTGERFIYIEKILHGANKGMVGNIWVLPSQGMSVEVSNNFPQSITRYEINSPYNKKFAKDEIIFTKYFNPSDSPLSLRGLSPLSVAATLVEQAMSERQYSNTALQNAGAYGALTLQNPETQRGELAKSIEALGKMKTELWKEIGSMWSNGKNLNARKLGMITGDWKYLNFGISPSDMAIVAQNKVTFSKLCNVYGVSDILFNNDSAATESNVVRMMNHFFENAVIPEVQSLVQSLNKAVSVPGRVFEMDMSDISEMQENTNDVVKRFADAPVFKPNDLFEALGYGRDSDPLNEQIYIKSGYTLLEDVGNPFKEYE